MKTRIILLFLICLNCTVFAQQNNKIITSIGGISLNGHWKGDDFGDDKDYRSIPSIPVVASIENGIVALDFSESVGDVTVVINKEDQTVFTQTYVVDGPRGYSIPVNAYAPGVYLLELSNSYGGYLYGWFELK